MSSKNKNKNEIVRSTVSFREALISPVDELSISDVVDSHVVMQALGDMIEKRRADLREAAIEFADEFGEQVTEKTKRIEGAAGRIEVTRPDPKPELNEGKLKMLLEEKGLSANLVFDRTLTISGNLHPQDEALLLQAIESLKRSGRLQITRRDLPNPQRIEGLLALGQLTPEDIKSCSTEKPATPRVSIKANDTSMDDLLEEVLGG